MKNKEIKKNTVNSNFYEGTDDKGCHFSFSQTDTGTEEDKRYWNEQVSWHAKQVAEHANQVPHSRTISFTHRRKEGDKIVENTRVFEVPVNGKIPSAKISEIDDSKAIDNGGASQSNKRQQTDDKENGSVKKSKGEDSHNNQSSLKRKGKRSEVKGEENKNSQESNSSKISSVETNNHKEAVVNPNNSSVSDSSSKVGVVTVFATFCAVLTGGIVGVRR